MMSGSRGEKVFCAERLALLAALCLGSCAAGKTPELLPAPGATAAASGATAIELAPGVVVDTTRGGVYLARPGGGIEALEARTGRLRWSSSSGDKPLAAVGGRLLVQLEAAASRLELRILDPATGETAGGAPIEVALGAGARAVLDENAVSSFTAAASPRGEGFRVDWRYLERWGSGVAPPPGERPFRRLLEGAFVIDGAGNLSPAPTPGETGTAAAPPPPAPGRRLVGAPWRAGPLFVAAALEYRTGGARAMHLLRWSADDHRPLEELTLIDSGAVAARGSVDGRHLLVSSMRDGRPATGDRYRWSLFEAETGRPVGAVSDASAAGPFVLFETGVWLVSQPWGRRAGDRWLEEPRLVREVSWSTGGERWRRAVRDFAYRGPRPPRP